MSHAATNWAIGQRGLKPLTKLLLWHLADAHNPSIGCFPSQARLAHELECSRSTVNLHLDILEREGKILREEAVDSDSGRQLPTRYFLAFEPEFIHKVRVRNSDTETGSNPNDGAEVRVRISDTDPVSENPGVRVRNSGKSVSELSDTVREPVIEPVIEPVMRARGGGDPDGPPPRGAAAEAATAVPVAPSAAPEPAKRPISEAERRRFHHQSFILDWLLGRKPAPLLFRELGLDDRIATEAAIEGIALSMPATYLRGVEGFVRWAEACLAGDPAAKIPIAPVKALMAELADSSRRALMARRLARLREIVAVLVDDQCPEQGEESATGPPAAA